MTGLAGKVAQFFVGGCARKDASPRDVGLVGDIEIPRLRQKGSAAGHFEQNNNPFHAPNIPRFAP